MTSSVQRISRFTGWFAFAAAIALALMMAAGGTATASAVSNESVSISAESGPTLSKCEKGVKNPDGTTRSYQDYALCMAAELELAQDAYNSGDIATAVDQVGEAYFGWYENNLEPASMTLPGNRKVKMEGRFTRLKIAIRNGADAETVHKDIEVLKVAVARDAMVLDGVLSKDSPESAGNELLTSQSVAKGDAATVRKVQFTMAFGLLLREGLEALLVVASIVLYLVKSGNRKLVRWVYAGVIAAIILSFALAWVIDAIIGGAGPAQEMLEGFTMFLAVGMLFYVSNWMLSKTSGENWQKYISGMVKTSVSSGAAKAIVFAAFLAVIREGAELVLFYAAAFSSEGNEDRTAIFGGFAAAAVCLAIIFLVIRYGGVRLPIRPIFYATSILLFAMCLSFVGKGVAELKEANIILGDTNLPWMTYYMPQLGIYPWAETLLPQIILFVAAVWIIWAHSSKRPSKSQNAPAETAEEQPAPSAEH